MTKTEQVTRNGQSGIKVTCDCSTHEAGANSAVIVGAAGTAINALKDKARDERIHGFVTMAHHPARMIRISNERKGVFAA